MKYFVHKNRNLAFCLRVLKFFQLYSKVFLKSADISSVNRSAVL